MRDDRRLWLLTLLLTWGALVLAALGTLTTLDREWARLGSVPYGLAVIRASTGFEPAEIYLLALIPALALGWIAARIAFDGLSCKWSLGAIGLALLALPLLVGFEQNGAWRWIRLGHSMHFLPGPWALLALTPVLVYLARAWRRTRLSRFLVLHIAISALGLTLLARQPDATMALLLGMVAVTTMVYARPVAGIYGVAALAVLVLLLWSVFAPVSLMRWLPLGHDLGMYEAARCGWLGIGADPAYAGLQTSSENGSGLLILGEGWNGLCAAWQASDWIGSGALSSRLTVYFIPEIAQGLILNGVAELFGRAAAWGVALVSLVHGAALIGLASARRQTDFSSQRWTVTLYGAMVLTTVLTTSAVSMGHEAPGFGLPWVSYGVNLTLFMSFVAGSAIGVAYRGSIRLPWRWLERLVSRGLSIWVRSEAALDATVTRRLLLSSAQTP